MISRLNVLSTRLVPRCSRDDHKMNYESGSWRPNSEGQSSYHCGFGGCSVRYDPTNGYHMLIGMPDREIPIDEPGVNTARCPQHGLWLYRRGSAGAQAGARWSCGVEGCVYDFDAKTKGNWVRN